MFYVAENSYASETSVGFHNTWYVIGFKTKALKNAYINVSKDVATKSILYSEINKYGSKAGAVSYYNENGIFINVWDNGNTLCSVKADIQIDPITAKRVYPNNPE